MKPEFMSKQAEAMTEEEMKLVKEFEKKEQELMEEREKYKKVGTTLYYGRLVYICGSFPNVY